MDLWTIMASYIGEGEDNLHRALRLAEACSPCVIWLDEIEKNLSGVEISNATGGGVVSSQGG
jgi:AAA+ superfamily predicted ATPase